MRVGPVWIALLLAAAVHAQDKPAKPKPLTPKQAADKVLVAFEAKAEKALKALAEKDKPDPWLVADELCFRGEHDAADAFATAAPRPTVEKLPDYVSGQRRHPTASEARERYSEARQAFSGGDMAAVLALTEKGALDSVCHVRLKWLQAAALRRRGRLRKSAALFDTTAKGAEALGWREGAFSLFHLAARSHIMVAAGPPRVEEELRPALVSTKRALDLALLLRDRERELVCLFILADFHQELREFDEALGHLHRVLRAVRARGSRMVTAAHVLRVIGDIEKRRGNYFAALERYEQALPDTTTEGDPRLLGMLLHGMGQTLTSVGRYDAAAARLEQALLVYRKAKLEHNAARVLGDIGNVHWRRGAFARALEYQHRSLDVFEKVNDPAGAAGILTSIGVIHAALGENNQAIAYYRRALVRAKDAGRLDRTLYALTNMGNAYDRQHRDEKAIECYERALALARKLRDMDSAMWTLGNIAVILSRRGAHDEAIAKHKEVLAWYRRVGDKAQEARALRNLSVAIGRSGDHVRAVESAESAAKLAREIGNLENHVLALEALAASLLQLDRPQEAVVAAREGITSLSRMYRELGASQAAQGRDKWWRIFEHGIDGALRIENVSELVHFLESGRASGLLESLGGAETVRGATLPPDLQEQETAARAAVRYARTRHARARAADNVDEIPETRTALDKAQTRLLRVVENAERTAKIAADLVYPGAAPVAQIKAALRGDQALVSYALLSKEAIAIVITRKQARYVRIGKTPDVEKAVAGLRFGASSGARGLARVAPGAGAWDKAAKASRKILIESLHLDRRVRTILLAPHGVLAYTPFVLLTDREVAYAPSGTTHIVLRDRAKRTGQRILALGDPVYGKARSKRTPMLSTHGELGPLPETRVEAIAIGDEVLLGVDASEAGFTKALGKRARWRSVHLACHGLVDPRRPLLSSLALTAEADNDGFLTTIEILRMKVPADLVVLSACQTGKGKIYRSEGVVGFTRAFMVAGAPRVIVSLWRVDDLATKELMVKFYELWNPKDGTKGLSTATALKKAQEYVRDHPKHRWKHPYYWAAWQLWGLPD